MPIEQFRSVEMRFKGRLPLGITILSALVISTLMTDARSPEPAFPQLAEATSGLPPLTKRGEYRYVYRVFFKLYDAALYSNSEASNSELLNAETPFRLQFRYLREIDKEIILESSAKMLEKNLTDTEQKLIQDRVYTLNRAYRTVRNGDYSSLTYLPGVGTTLRINGQEIVTIPGQDFAKHYFTIWLGEQSLSASLRDSLLGLK